MCTGQGQKMMLRHFSKLEKWLRETLMHNVYINRNRSSSDLLIFKSFKNIYFVSATGLQRSSFPSEVAHLFKIYFIDYAIVAVPFSRLYSPTPRTPLPAAFPHLSSCPWVELEAAHLMKIFLD